jgi:hypothetical protein
MVQHNADFIGGRGESFKFIINNRNNKTSKKKYHYPHTSLRLLTKNFRKRKVLFLLDHSHRGGGDCGGGKKVVSRDRGRM